MDLSGILIGVGITGVTACAGLAGMRALDRYRVSVAARVRQESESGSRLWRQKPTGPRAAIREASKSALRAQLVPNRDEDRQRHQSRLIRAGIYSPTALSTFFATKLALMLAPPVIGLAIGINRPNHAIPVLMGCIGGVTGMLLPTFWIDRRIRHRQRGLRRALPDMLDLMTVCLEGGLSLQGTLQRVGDELGMAHPSLAGELTIVQREIDLGVPVHGALRRLADRTGCEGIRRLATCMRDAQRQGTDLAGALRIHSDTMRDQREAEAEETAQKASVKILIPTLLFIFPAVFVVIAGPAAIRIHESFNQSHGSQGASP
jgi:tight adherence protein C